MGRPIIVDTDPGHDDALALLIALAADSLEVTAVTVVHGNHVLEKTARNACQILETADRTDVPVAAGMDRPMVREPLITTHVHGETGLDGPDLPVPTIEPIDDHAVDLIIDHARQHDELTLLPIGPLSNLGMAFRKAPAIVDRVDQIVFMGGAIGRGNQTPSAEFNVLADPEAADLVFEQEVPLTMVGLDATHEAVLPAERFQEIRALDSPVATMVADLLEFYAAFYRDRYDIDGVVIHDAVAVATLIEPSIVETRPMAVSVDTGGEYTDGRTVCDVHDVTNDPATIDVATGVDSDAFVDLLFDHLGRY